MGLERIRDLRENCGLNQNQLGEMIGVTQRAYSFYETGKRQIPLDILCTLADYYNTSVDYLLERTDVKNPYPRRNQSRKSGRGG